ncbi:Mov34/MPN/PAD-1 family protein [bacterium]|nr:Mov34/MPN/PAD-1 family protein [bacterium]
MSQPESQIDIDRIALGELRVVDFPAPESMESFRVHIQPEVHQQIVAHSLENDRIELCGVLVGEPCRDQKGAMLLINAAIRGEHAAHESAQVTFTQETWAHIHREMDTRFPTSRIVGWYHTHPGFGVFLSSMDLFIQENFFNLPWQVAFVIDPRSKDEGFFCWKNGETSRMSHYWVGEKETLFLPSATASAGDLAEKVRRMEQNIGELKSFRAYFTRRLDGVNHWLMLLWIVVFLALAGSLYATYSLWKQQLLIGQIGVKEDRTEDVAQPGDNSTFFRE